MRGNAIVPCKAVHGPVSLEVRNRRLATSTKSKPFCSEDRRVWEPARHLCLLLLLLVACLVSACGVYDRGERKAILTVGKRSLTAEQLKREMRRLVAEQEIVSENNALLRRVLVEKIVDHFLVLEYGREKGITVSQEEIDTAVGEIRQDYGETDFQEILLKRCINLEEWKEGLRDQILTRKIIENVLESVPHPTTQEIRAYFDTHSHEFKNPSMIKVRQVVTSTKKEAQELLRRMKEGEKMEVLALNHSIAPDGKMKGEIGWIRQGEMEEGIEKVIFSLPVGRLSRIVETSYGFHIFQIVSKRSEGAHFLPEVASEIERNLFSQKAEAFFNDWLKTIRDAFPVSIDQGLLEELEWA
jgi:parvulin-like peptidyl-prolyl isomerase